MRTDGASECSSKMKRDASLKSRCRGPMVRYTKRGSTDFLRVSLMDLSAPVSSILKSPREGTRADCLSHLSAMLNNNRLPEVNSAIEKVTWTREELVKDDLN